MLKRREFITLLGGTAVAPLLPPAALAQQPMPVVGVLLAVPYISANSGEFERGLSEAGFVDSRNVTFERRSAEGRYERLPALAAELVQRRVAVIAAVTPVAALAAKAATTTIPIVFELGSDPVKDGLVASLARPGGNVTGVTFFNNLLTAKRLELLHDIAPGLTVVGLLSNPENANADLEVNEAQAGSRSLGLQLVIARATTEEEIESGISALARQGAKGLLLAGDAFLSSNRTQIVALALRHGMATCHPERFSVDAGGLVGYAASRSDADHQFGLYVGRVLKGEKPADLPVVQPTKFEMVINLKTATALGLTISRELLFRADEVIE